MIKEEFKAIVNIEGHIEMSIQAVTMEDAMSLLLEQPIFKMIRDADDSDLEIDVEKIWKVDG